MIAFIILSLISISLGFYILKNKDDPTSLVLGGVLLGIMLVLAVFHALSYTGIEYTETYDVRSLDADAVAEACRVSPGFERDFSF